MSEATATTMTTSDAVTEIQSTDIDTKSQTIQYDMFSLPVKKEFVSETRPASLPPLPILDGDSMTTDVRDDRDRPSESRRDKKFKKKRPRDARIDSAAKVCLAIIRGESCPYGDGCRFSHDMKEFMASRPEDINNKILGSVCPYIELYGYCVYGAMCRLGASHINMSTGENIRKDIDGPKPKPILNTLPKEVQIQLRKKSYPFKHQRYNERGGKNSRETTAPKDTEKVTDDALEPPSNTSAEEGRASSSIDMSPLPDRTRKLIDFSKKVYVAPLTTVGNLPFRRIMKKFGADITCGEMAVATNLLSGQSSEWALLKRHPEEDIFGVQIAAGYPDVFARTCELIENEMNVDFVDLNLGCPLDIVCNKGSGAALMMRDKRLRSSVEGILETLTCPISIKMRTGWEMTKPFAHNLVQKIQSWGLDGISAVMIHGRSRLQRYAKEADWDYISMVAKSQDMSLTTIPVIGNGDIFSYQDFEEKIAREGVNSCAMLARGALIKPWLPTEIKERRHWDISASERLDILKDFARFGMEHWGTDQQGINNCRRFLLEWLSFLHRYCPVGLLEVLPQHMNQRPPAYICGRSDLETLLLSPDSSDWIKISEMLLGPVPDGFRFEPKHKAKGFKSEG
jgi:tRNA-dihydrouridine synthase 3